VQHGQVLDRAAHLHPQLVQPAGHVHGPHVVPEVALDLAHHGGHREGRELHAARRVEPVDGVDQADRADLDDVLHRLVPAAEAGGGVAHQGEVDLDQRRPHPGVLGAAGLQAGQLLEEHLGEGPGFHRVAVGGAAAARPATAGERW
jgi:hypothetical protein